MLRVCFTCVCNAVKLHDRLCRDLATRELDKIREVSYYVEHIYYFYSLIIMGYPNLLPAFDMHSGRVLAVW